MKVNIRWFVLLPAGGGITPKIDQRVLNCTLNVIKQNILFVW